MIKILIVDDEPLVRIGIRSALDWEANGYRIIGEAANGELALQSVEKDPPDIIITDIKMPLLDGIGLIKEVKCRFPYIKIIALSSHNDFDYVREAMKSGAVDYLLKNNLDPEKVLFTLGKLKDEITKGKLVSNDSDAYNLHINECISILKDNFLKDVISGIIADKDKIRKGINNFNLEPLDGKFVILTVLVDDFKTIQKKYIEKDETLLRFSIKNMLEEILGSNSNCELFIASSREYIILWPFKDNIQKSLIDENISEACNNFKEVFKDYLNISVSIGISNLHTGVNQIQKAYIESSKAVGFRFYRGKGNNIRYAEIYEMRFVPGTCSLSHQSIDRLKMLVKTLDIKLSEDIFEKIRSQIILTQSYLNIDDARNLYILLAEKFNSLFYEEYREKAVNLDVYGKIVASEDIFDIENILKKHFTTCLESKHIQFNEKDINKIDMAIGYINSHFDRELTLQLVAEKVNLNPFYFSRLFKKGTGESFTDYLIKIRIDKSKELLHQGLKAFEASEKVGYYNYAYFSKLFKKVVGVNPSDYSTHKMD